MRVQELLAPARERLRRAPFAPSSREAGLLLARILGWSEAQLLARTDAKCRLAATDLRALLERRLTGEPVAYLLRRARVLRPRLRRRRRGC